MRNKLPALLRLIFAVVLGATAVAHAAQGARPNVLLIVTDDQGTVDAGCFGAKDISTPNLDALAGRGVKLTQFYAAAPVCSPSRAAILTGCYPQRVGLQGNAPSHAGGQGGMLPEAVTIAEVLKAAGYTTAHIGKWHMGYTPERMPNAQGFDHSFGHMGGCIDNYSHFFYWAGPNVHDLHRNGREIHLPGEFFPDLMVREASEFMERNRERPFFIYFAINMPHYPYQGDPKWLERCRDLPYPRNLYAAFVGSMDDRVGRLLRKLDELALRERTIVVFQSDNGHSVEERAHFGGGSAGPHRGAKFSLFEGGIRVPAIISWPGQLPVGESRTQMGIGCDWLPTIAELCGVDVRKLNLDGKSLVPVLKSPQASSPHEVLHWQTGGLKNPNWAVRSGPWKLLGAPLDNAGPKLAPEDKRLFLANIVEDLGEQSNYAARHPDVVEKLQEQHQSWVKTLNP